MAINLKQLAGIAIMFVTIAIILSVGSDVVSNVQTNVDDSMITVSNETVALVNGTQMLDYRISSITSLDNSTNVVNAGNYSINALGALQFAPPYEDTTWVDGTSYNITYTGLLNTAAYNATAFGLNANNTLASWLPVIALIIAAAVVIGMIGLYFFKGGL